MAEYEISWRIMFAGKQNTYCVDSKKKNNLFFFSYWCLDEKQSSETLKWLDRFVGGPQQTVQQMLTSNFNNRSNLKKKNILKAVCKLPPLQPG